MKVEVFTGGPFETNSYLLIENNNCLLIDPTFGSYDFFISNIEKNNLTPLAIILTHSHIDHIADVAKIKKHLKIKVYVHPLDQKNLINPGSDGLPFWEKIEGCSPDELIYDGQEINLQEFSFTVLHTPGHSFGSCCFYFKQEDYLFSGDTLFQGTYGNISFPTSEPKKMKTSLHRLSTLPKETVVFPGHGLPTTIEEEKWLLELDEKFFN